MMRRSWVWPVVGAAALALGGCQGTEWGEQVRRAVQVPEEERSSRPEDLLQPDPPSSPTTPRPTPADTDEETDPTPRPETISTPFTSDPDPATPEPAPDADPEPRFQFSDLDSYPLASQAVQQLNQLGVFSEISGPEFGPERSVRRGEFARWLIQANNAIHAQIPSSQIRLARSGERPIFLDVPEDHPDFTTIQALGAAGIAEGDQHQEFRPDSLLSRAALVQLKAPLDLPPGEIEGDRADLEEEWGFTDAEEIPEAAVPAIVADRSLGEQSSILRAFGPIRSFDPQKPVTRAEAALALSAFGERTASQAIEQGPAPTPILPAPAPSPSPSPTPTPTPDPSPSPTPTPTPDPSPESTLTPTPTPDPQDSPDPEPNSDSPESAPGEFVTPAEDTDDPEP